MSQHTAQTIARRMTEDTPVEDPPRRPLHRCCSRLLQLTSIFGRSREAA